MHSIVSWVVFHRRRCTRVDVKCGGSQILESGVGLNFGEDSVRSFLWPSFQDRRALFPLSSLRFVFRNRYPVAIHLLLSGTFSAQALLAVPTSSYLLLKNLICCWYHTGNASPRWWLRADVHGESTGREVRGP